MAAQTFLQRRATEAARAKANYERIAAQSDALARAAEDARREARLALDLVDEYTRPWTTQNALKAGFAALRKAGYDAKQDDSDMKGDRLAVRTGKVYWWDGEPMDSDPNASNGRWAKPDAITVWFNATETDARHKALPEVISILREHGACASMDGKHAIRIEPRHLRCESCRGDGYRYGEKGREDCAACAKKGVVPNPAWEVA